MYATDRGGVTGMVDWQGAGGFRIFDVASSMFAVGLFRIGQCMARQRISVCKRRGHPGRCPDHGVNGFDRWIGWGVIETAIGLLTE